MDGRRDGRRDGFWVRPHTYMRSRPLNTVTIIRNGSPMDRSSLSLNTVGEKDCPVPGLGGTWGAAPGCGLPGKLLLETIGITNSSKCNTLCNFY